MAIDASELEPETPARQMIKGLKIFAAGALGLSFDPARAQSAPQLSTDDPGARGTIAGALRPGHLTPREVIDKQLLDFMGNSLGVVQAVSPDGHTAIVMPGGNAVPFTVEMSRLSLGMGTHTIVEDARKDIDVNP